MDKINIIFDAEILVTHKGGLFFGIYNTLQALHKCENVNITLAYPLICPEKKMKENPFLSQFARVCSGEGESQILDNIQKHKNGKRYAKMLYHCFRLAKFKTQKKLYYNEDAFISAIKNVHIYFSPFFAIPQIVRKDENIKKICVLHDAIPFIFNTVEPTFRRLLESIDENTFCFCVSQSCKDDFIKYFPGKLDTAKMFVIYNGGGQHCVPNYNRQELEQVLNKYNITHNPDDKYIFTINISCPRKNAAFTISCFIKFIKKHNIKDLFFYLGGKAPENVVNMVKNAGEYRDKIKLPGYIDAQDINILYSNSLFFTFLSQYEGFGMPPLEAMQAGTPVITSNNSSLPEVVGDAAISLAYNDEHAVIKAFEDLYFNEDLRKEYIEKGQERAKMFSWEKCAGQMIEIIKNILIKEPIQKNILEKTH